MSTTAPSLDLTATLRPTLERQRFPGPGRRRLFPGAGVRSITHGKLFNAGQTCVAPDYALVPAAEAGRFAAMFAEQASGSIPP